MMFSLGPENWMRLFIWLVLGLVIYFGYSRHHSALRTNRLECFERLKGLAQGRVITRFYMSRALHPPARTPCASCSQSHNASRETRASNQARRLWCRCPKA